MVKCPNCGSTAQVKVIVVEFEEDPCGAIRYKTYKCGCGRIFTGTSYYTCQECYEIVEKIEKRG